MVAPALGLIAGQNQCTRQVKKVVPVVVGLICTGTAGRSVFIYFASNKKELSKS